MDEGFDTDNPIAALVPPGAGRVLSAAGSVANGTLQPFNVLFNAAAVMQLQRPFQVV
ncbi:hypothetical protein D3C76_1813010 [compost metagenome]